MYAVENFNFFLIHLIVRQIITYCQFKTLIFLLLYYIKLMNYEVYFMEIFFFFFLLLRLRQKVNCCASEAIVLVAIVSYVLIVLCCRVNPN